MDGEPKVELSIIVPAYNEKNRVGRTLDAYFRFFDATDVSYEVIVADYSNDGSKEVIRELQKSHKNLVLLDITKRGKGLAVFEGFKIGKGKFLSFTDADNATPPDEFYKIYKSIEGYAAAIGSRGLAKSKVVHYHQSWLRKLGSFVLDVFFVRGLFGLSITDTQCGAKVFRREDILPILPQMRITNSIFDVELLWRLSKVGKIKEVPIQWIDDTFSHFKWKNVVNEFLWLWRVRIGI